jgi:hypothetical protein
MRQALVNQLAHACFAIALLLCASLAAQDGRSRTRANVTRLEFNRLRSPYLKGTTTHSGAEPEYQWLQVFIEFDIQGGRNGWTDEVTVDWFVLVRPPDARPMLLQETTTFVDVEDGKRHAAVYIRPGFIRRYCGTRVPNESHFAAYAEVSAGGQRLTREEYSRSRQPDNWWRAKEPQVRLVADELLPPAETPFAMLDYDFYEHPKRKRP